MNMSGQIGQLAAALAKAQGAIQTAKKDKANPFFKSKYADLASVWEACREPLSSNGLSVVQFPSLHETRVTVTTVLMHASGEWLSDELSAPIKGESTPQAIGSLVTYLRRYSLSAIAGVAPDEDDDGEQAMGRQTNGNGHRPSPKPEKPDAASVALMDECVQAVAQAKDDARLKQIIANVEGYLQSHKLTEAQAKGVGEAIRNRRKELGTGASA